MRVRPLLLAASVAVAAIGVPAAASDHGRFPSSDPDPRVGTPDDPRFDCAEPDDPDDAQCSSIFDEQYELFGFAPASTEETAVYREGPSAGEPMIAGIRADRGWKHTIGSPEVAVAVTDSGIEWGEEELRRQVFLNVAELPQPEGASDHDADGDGAVTVDDWAADPRVGDANGNGLLDAQDLIRTFSDGTDADHNGYVDDIAGWDFLDDDNDPEDSSSYSASRGHGTGRMEEAAADTHNGAGEAGVCPRCRVVPLRVWDTFVVPGDQWAMATVYTADIGAKVQVVANGVLQNTRAMQAANRYAYDHGVALMHVSSDLNTANHNYPTNYPESVFINGCVTDVEGLGEDAEDLTPILTELGLGSQAPVATYFRSSNLTQYGAHAHVCTMGDTGSQATGQAGGAAGLLVSRGLELADTIGGPLSSNEVKQLLTMTAEDVLPGNTVGTGVPDPSQPGWDEYFGYGRVDLEAALTAIEGGHIPPEAFVDGPPWWAMLDPVATPEVPVVGRVAAQRSTGFDWRLEYGIGVQPADDAFTVFAQGSGTAPIEGELGRIPLDEVAARIPGASDGTPPEGPNDYVFTVRLVVEDADGLRGEDRRAYFAFSDPTLHEGWPRFVDSGGESSPVLYDLDGDATLEIVEANSSGEVTVTEPDGTPDPGFNGGAPWILPPTYNWHDDAPGFASGAVPPPTSGARTPVVADVDDDLLPEIVVAAGDGRVFVLERDGTVADGFPVELDPSLSEPSDRTPDLHPKRGLLGNPSVADLDGDGTSEIVVSAMDGHVYVWDATSGALRDGFPVALLDPAVEDHYGLENVTTPTLADLDGDGDLEIVAMSNELYAGQPPSSPPSDPGDLRALLTGLVSNLLFGGAGQSTRLYALHDDGSLVDGWPVAINGLAPGVLPLVGPGHTVAAGDLDGDGADEVVASATTAETILFDGDGSEIATLPSQPAAGNGVTDPSKVINLFEYPVVGDLNGVGGLDVVKSGLTTNGVVNLLLVGQNLPFDHVVQAWDTATGTFEPGFPVATDDYSLLSTPVIADVDGDGRNDAVAGNGLYLIRAFGALGREAEGFPKLTGGWTFPVPAVGDVDADGQLEMVGSTREGWRFLWDLDAPATAAANSEWWTEGHDERHTNRHGTDARPPTRIQDLEWDGDELRFTATGDDWLVGTADRYEVRWSAAPIRDAADLAEATLVEDVPAPSPSGTAEVLALDLPAAARSLAVVVVDDDGNRSQLAVAGRGGQPADPGGGGSGEAAPGASVRAAAAAETPRTGGGLVVWALGVLALALGTRRRTCRR